MQMVDRKEPRIIFGQPPTDFNDALRRLPTTDHPLLLYHNNKDQNEDLAILATLRAKLNLTKDSWGNPFLLGKRLTLLTSGEMELMEQWSFKRSDTEEFFFWSALPDQSYWRPVFSEHNDYHLHWTLGQLKPHEGVEPMSLVSIGVSEEIADFSPQKYHVGLVTNAEWRRLNDELWVAAEELGIRPETRVRRGSGL